MKTVTLALGKWNDIVLVLAKAAQAAEDHKDAKVIHGLMIDILEGQVDVPEEQPFKYEDCITYDDSGSYYTILSYLAIFHPDYLDNIDYKDPTTTQRAGFWLMHNYKGNIGNAPAPEFFEKYHIKTLKTYPKHALDALYLFCLPIHPRRSPLTEMDHVT